jgi:hypothetical protein
MKYTRGLGSLARAESSSTIAWSSGASAGVVSRAPDIRSTSRSEKNQARRFMPSATASAPQAHCGPIAAPAATRSAESAPRRRMVFSWFIAFLRVRRLEGPAGGS